jgi:NADH:ubiquinone oxidoreductase subunit E
MNVPDILGKFLPEKDNMLGILHELQDNNIENYLCMDDLKAVAEYLNTSLSHVYGVATYYTMFSLKPRGKFIIRVCNSPVCNMEGSLNVIKELKNILGAEPGETTSDRNFTIELSECLGQCDIAPGIMINEDVFGNLDAARLKSIINNYKNR